MGCGESKERTPFREKDSISWNITNSQWKAHVEKTYTRELVEASGIEKINDVELRQQLEETKVKNEYVVGRSIYVHDDFVSWGRILVKDSLWESYEGTWINNDVVFGSGAEEEFVVERTPGGGLVCKATGKRGARDDVYLAFHGAAFRLGGDSDDEDEVKTTEKEMTPEEKKAAEQAKKEAEELAKRKKEYPVWRRNKDGSAELNVSRGIDDAEDWQPIVLKFDSDYAGLTILKNDQKLGYFKRQIPTDRADRRWEGQDLVFGDNIDRNQFDKDSKYVCLHMVKVNQEKKMLQIVYSHGRTGKGKPGSLSVPIPPAKMAEMSKFPQKCQPFLQPLIYNGRRYEGDDVMQFIALWMMMDIAIFICAYALVFGAIAGMEAIAAADAAGAFDGGDEDGGASLLGAFLGF